MKFCSLTRKHRGCPPRTRFGVLGHLPTTHASSAQRRTLHPIRPGSTPNPYFEVPGNSFYLPTYLAVEPLHPIQNP
jgi:hypothetical protein